MATNQKGGSDVVDYVAGSAISSEDVLVLGAAGNVSVGVALDDIANGDTGAVAIQGVWTLAKTSTAVIAQGETVNWDVSAGGGAGEVDDNAATAATGDVEDFGIAVAAAGNGTTTCDVLLLPGNGSIA